MTSDPDKVRKAVKEEYGAYARSEPSCCSGENPLYQPDLLEGMPEDIANFSAGSGDPVTPAKLQPGETVLDLGSGGGLDCFLAAREVGKDGMVIGVDMTSEMLQRARGNAQRLGVTNVEFREGYLESLPVGDNSVDVIISNCVINLSPDKPQVFREMFRVLKPGGRVSVSDIVTNHSLSEEQRGNMKDWCGCTSGALASAEYTAELGKAGFVDIHLAPNLEIVEKAIVSGGVRSMTQKEVSREEVLELVRNWDKAPQTMFVPHLITARKPG